MKAITGGALKGAFKFPITAKLKPNSADNLLYMAEIALLTRLATGVARVLQNKPEKNKDKELTLNDKRKSFAERIFVEIFGTLGYMFSLHLGQDLTAKLFEGISLGGNDPKITKRLLGEKLAGKLFAFRKKLDVFYHLEKSGIMVKLGDAEKEQLTKAVTEVFGKNPWGIIQRTLYGSGAKNGNMLTALGKQLNNPALFAKVETGMKEFVMGLNRRATASVLGGVGISALFGGVVIQWLNDRLVSPITAVILDEFSKPPGTPAGPATANNATPPPAHSPASTPAMGLPMMRGQTADPRATTGTNLPANGRTLRS